MDGKELVLFLFVEVDSGAARIDLLTLEVRICIAVVRLLGWKIVLLIRPHMVPILVDEIMELMFFSYCCTLFWFLLPRDRWMDEKWVDFLDGWPHIQVRLWIVAVTFLDEKGVDVFSYLCILFQLFWFCCSGWIDGWKRSWFLWRIDLVRRWDYGLRLSPSWTLLLCCQWINGWMDGGMKKELVFLGLVWFVWLCGGYNNGWKRDWSSVLSCSVPLDGKELDFCLIVQLFVLFLFHSQEDGLQKHELMNNWRNWFHNRPEGESRCCDKAMTYTPYNRWHSIQQHPTTT